MNIIKNPFVAGLFLALSVVISDALNAFILNPTQAFNWWALLIAAGIALVGYVGQFFTGSTNTILAMLGSALVAIVPLLQGESIDWRLVLAMFIVKFIGIKTNGLSASHLKSNLPPPSK